MREDWTLGGPTIRLRRLALAAPVVAGIALGLSSPGATRLTVAEAAGAVECFGKAATIESNAEFVPGTEAADVIVTGGNANGIVAFEGRDRVCSGPGNDELFGHDGADVIDGGPGTDTCRGGPGQDKLTDCER